MSEKKPSSAPRGAEESNPAQSAAGCFRQLVWSIGGLGVLVILWIAILREPPWTFSQKDVLFWGAAATMIAARGVLSTSDVRNAIAASREPA